MRRSTLSADTKFHLKIFKIVQDTIFLFLLRDSKEHSNNNRWRADSFVSFVSILQAVNGILENTQDKSKDQNGYS